MKLFDEVDVTYKYIEWLIIGKKQIPVHKVKREIGNIIDVCDNFVEIMFVDSKQSRIFFFNETIMDIKVIRTLQNVG